MVSDTAYVLSGWVGDVFSPHLFLRKYNCDGTVLFDHVYTDYDAISRCLNAYENNYYIGGFKLDGNYIDGMILKADQEGNEEWTLETEEIEDALIESMTRDEGENIFVTARKIWYESILFMGIDPDGNQIAQFNLESSVMAVGNLINDGEYLYLTGSCLDEDDNAKPFLVKVNMDSIMTKINEKEIITNQQIQVFPNPVNDQINIQIPLIHSSDPLIFTISDARGTILEKWIENASKSIKHDVTNYGPGVYFLRIHGGNFKSITQKFIISK